MMRSKVATAVMVAVGASAGFAASSWATAPADAPAPVTRPHKGNDGVAKLLVPTDGGKWVNDSEVGVTLRRELNVR